MVVLSQKTCYLVVCPSNIGYIVTVPTENGLHGSIQLKTDYIVVYPPENWLPLYSSISPIHLLNGSPISENWLYSSISPLKLAIYLVVTFYRSFVTYRTRFSQVFSYVIKLRQKDSRESCVTL